MIPAEVSLESIKIELTDALAYAAPFNLETDVSTLSATTTISERPIDCMAYLSALNAKDTRLRIAAAKHKSHIYSGLYGLFFFRL